MLRCHLSSSYHRHGNSLREEGAQGNVERAIDSDSFGNLKENGGTGAQEEKDTQMLKQR